MDSIERAIAQASSHKVPGPPGCLRLAVHAYPEKRNMLLRVVNDRRYEATTVFRHLKEAGIVAGVGLNAITRHRRGLCGCSPELREIPDDE